RDAADVVPVADADHGLAGRLAGGVGGLDAGIEREPELDEAEQQEDQQGKEQRELDRGSAVLIPFVHRVLDQGPGGGEGGGEPGEQSWGAGSVATQLPTSWYLFLTELNSV